jgi:phosphatidylinositol alpha-1,6-mannosyltransferase
MAVIRASSRKWPARLILVWHIGMLKLLPFVRARGARVALFLHGIEAWRRPSPATGRLLRNVDLLLTNSDFTWKRFLEFHPEWSGAAHRTVHLGVGVPPMGEQAAPADPPSVLMIGRIARSEAYKGHDAVMAAWPHVLERIPGAQLRIIGPCDMPGELLARAAKQVEILGAVSEEEKERYLAECRVMALPSKGEGFGLVYPEAMRMGRPCIVSTVDAGREVVGDAGLAVDPSDVAQLAPALIRTLTAGPEWNAWSQAARARYESRYTEAHFRDRLLSALAAVS